MPTTGQAARPRSWAPADVGRMQLRGVAQVALSASPWTGLLFTVALFAGGWRIGVYGLLGVAASTVAAFVLGADRDGLANGLEGYCGCLTSIAIVVRLGASWRTALLAVLAAAVCAVLGAAVGHLLGRIGLPALTAPFCLVAGVLAPALPTAPAAAAPPLPGDGATTLSASELGHAFCDNFGQVFFLDKWYAGLILLVGLLVASWGAAVAAACGSLAAILTACAMGLPAERISEGLYGYNAVLVAIALAATFLTRTPWTAGYTALAAVASVPFTAAWQAFAQPSGGSPFTWPFVVTTWLFLAAVPALDRPGLSFEKAK
ncbi:urea transporter [Streptomyces rugosispiralis]|uniref:Urea transporter n=1 Tax=Streptomyces rugosispiralis TaxID=2967341 RepID=A0ABT1V7D1_9ACTN|nr:urea transporter [Streptomyces rugosispiralis]MCQ8193293.1 urea transporter [Streptomyces rugosispiralis]